ncbi:hypothetical protein [Terrisporobacter petrolearius]|uniref:hypothetical protein n=1 Tax=Terrisporobacter petrolearius TaxID=1460447 RepID=UPI003AFF7C3B
MNKKNIDLAGMNIYLNASGNTVYYNVFDKKGYIVGYKIEQKFRLFYYRYFMIITLMVLLGDYFKSFENTLLVGGFAAIAAEVYFRGVFLKQLKSIDNFKRDRKVNKIEMIIKNSEKEKTIMKACAYVLLSILIVINAIQQNYNLVFMALSGMISIYGVYSALLSGMALRKMNIK